MPSQKRTFYEATVGSPYVTANPAYGEYYENPWKRAKPEVNYSIPTEADPSQNGIAICDGSQVYSGSNVPINYDQMYGMQNQVYQAETFFDMRVPVYQPVQYYGAPTWIPEAPVNTAPIQNAQFIQQDAIGSVDVVVPQRPVYHTNQYNTPSPPLDNSPQVPSVQESQVPKRRPDTILAFSEDVKDSTKRRVTNRIDIKRDEVARVAPPTYFNDNLVLFFLNEVLRSNPQIVDRTFVFDSVVFSRIVGTKFFNDSIHLGSDDSAELFKNCKFTERWTRKVNLFSKDLIVMPICHDEHWMLAVIVNPKKGIIEPKDLNRVPEADEMVRIYFMDPMGRCDKKRNNRVLAILFVLLKKQFQFHKARKGSPYSKDSEYHLSRVKLVVPKNLPIQPNFYDCGPFVCHFLQGVLNKRRGLLARKDLNTLSELDWNTVVPNAQQKAEDMRQTVLTSIEINATSSESVDEMDKILNNV